MEVTIRPVLEADMAFAKATHHRAYHDAVVKQFGSWDEKLQDDFFSSVWATTRHDILLKDGEPCGYIGFDKHAKYIWVRELVIHPKFQNLGIGTAMINFFIEKARKSKVSVKLRIFRTNRAIDLYYKLGFWEYDRTKTHIMIEWNEAGIQTDGDVE